MKDSTQSLNNNFTPNSDSLSGPYEVAVVEKLLANYGFLKCIYRNERLFFHFSAFNGDISALNIGDFVEFQEAVDKRSLKPVAVSVCKMDLSSQALEEASTKPQEGVIFAIPHSGPMRQNGHSSQEDGTIAYQLKGETFYFPFDLENIVTPYGDVNVGDKVQFRIVKNKLTHLCSAKDVAIISRPTLVKGVVCTLKESFGFIEREDVVKEVFFHFSEFIGDISQFEIGTEVEFEVIKMGRKDVACKIRVLPKGTVVFDELDPTTRIGRVVKTIDRGKKMKDLFSGRIVYDDENAKCVEIPFGDKDIIGTYTLFEEDIVEFKIATDKRDKMKRATAIKLLEQSFLKSKEVRETGIIVKLEENHGFVKSENRWEPIQFSFSEIMTERAEIAEGDPIIFSIVFDPLPRAVRLSVINKSDGVDYLAGVVLTEISAGDPSVPGSIIYERASELKRIPLYLSDIKSTAISTGDTVKFRISKDSATGEEKAVDLSVVYPKCSLGYVTVFDDHRGGLIEWFGFEQELSFIPSACALSDIQVGDEVEFTIDFTYKMPQACNIKKADKFRIKPQVYGDLRRGVVVKICSSGKFFPLEDNFFGEIQERKEDGSPGMTVPYSFGSLLNKSAKVCSGDQVMFALGTFISTEPKAFYVALLKDVKRGTIDSLKAHYGFINEIHRKRKLFFHSSFAENFADLHPGDEVEYVTVFSPKVNKFNAIIVKKSVHTLKPAESKIKRPKPFTDKPCVVLVRQPRIRTDDSRGFNVVRVNRLPGQLLD